MNNGTPMYPSSFVRNSGEAVSYPRHGSWSKSSVGIEM